MSNLTKTKTAKIVGLFIAVFMLVGVGVNVANAALTEAQIQSILSLLDSFGVDSATRVNVNASLRGQATTGTVVVSSACPYVWARDLSSGATGDDVMKLQKFLNSDAATMVASSGVGSIGNETSYFGPATAGAVAKFQNKYASEVLTPLGLSAGTGYYGSASRAKANSLCSSGTVGTPTTPGTPVVTPLGSGLTVSKNANQPANSLAPGSAARLPFTKVDLTASSDGAVTVNSLTVERQGLSSDTAFLGIVLLNEDGTLIGIEKTLNSNHQAIIGTDFTIPAGTTKTVTVGVNMDTSANLGGEAGEVPSFAVIAVNTSATVYGSLPIVGATHTINNSLSIGSVSDVARGSLDPGSSQTKEVGLTGYVFSSIKLTAGSVEDLTLKSIRWYQSESASVDDTANVKTVVDGVKYNTVRDGRYYVTVFPSGGILIKKGFNKDVSIQGDILGGSNRIADFDIDRRTDIHVVGNLYGFGIVPPFSTGTTADAAAFRTTNNPYYDAAQVTISNGTMNVSSWTAGVPAQNIAVNLADQPIMGLSVDVKGEPISVSSMVFDFTLTGTAAGLGLADVTNVVLVDSNGKVLSGPADGAGATANSGSITLSDAITFPVGITNVLLKAKLGTDFVTDNTIAASTTPGSTSYFTTVTGQVTGNTITPTPASAITGSTQTVKAGALSVSVSSQPTARTVISGATKFEFARYILDAGQSGEDVRLTTLPLDYSTTGAATGVSNCKLHDGIEANALPLTTGSNIRNPSAVGSTTSLTFDGTGLILAKGTSKILSLRCDIVTGTTATFYWGLVATADNGGYTGASGITSGQTIAEVFNRSTGQRMIAAANGSYTVANDSSVLNKAAQAGAVDVTLAKIRFDAGPEEAIDIKQIALELRDTASNTPTDLVGQKVTVWNGAVKVGDATFGLGGTDTQDFATSSLSAVRIPASESVTLTVKGSLSTQDVNSVVGAFGALVGINYDGNNNGLGGNYATGVDSGATISGGTTADTAGPYTQIYRGLLTVEDVTTTSALSAGTDLYKIKLTAALGRDVTVHAVSFNVSSVGLSSVSGFQLFGPSGAVNATGVASSSSNSLVADGSSANRLRIIFDDTSSDRIIQAGTSKTYSLRANTISTLTANNTETLTIALLSDTAILGGGIAFHDSTAHLASVRAIGNSASSSDRFVWSPNSTTTVTATVASNSIVDWANGYGLPGFPSVGQDMTTRVFNH